MFCRRTVVSASCTVYVAWLFLSSSCCWPCCCWPSCCPWWTRAPAVHCPTTSPAPSTSCSAMMDLRLLKRRQSKAALKKMAICVVYITNTYILYHCSVNVLSRYILGSPLVSLHHTPTSGPSRSERSVCEWVKVWVGGWHRRAQPARHIQAVHFSTGVWRNQCSFYKEQNSLKDIYSGSIAHPSCFYVRSVCS